MSNLDGQRILVTGAAGGLGTALVADLLARGAQVTGLVKTSDDARRLETGCAGGSARVLIADLAELSEIEIALNYEIAAHGPFYGVVNNAAIYPKAMVEDLDPAEMISVLQVNAVAAATIVRVCAPGLKSLGDGRIVNVASITFDTGMAELGAYVASKGALIGMTRVWARELGPHGITVNAVAPGAFKTEAEAIHSDPEGYERFVIGQQALKRRGESADFAHLVTFLLSDRASFITGQTIRVDGGWVTR